MVYVLCSIFELHIARLITAEVISLDWLTLSVAENRMHLVRLKRLYF